MSMRSAISSLLSPRPISIAFNRSHIVNLKHVRSLEDYERRMRIRLSDNSEVIASQSGAQVLENLLF
jgi:DNA-binding LytR/AlgR family response regulator